MKRIQTGLTKANIDVLDKSLKDALTANICPGITADRDGLFILLADDATKEDIERALSIAATHDPEVLSVQQQEEKQGVTDIGELFQKVDTALADLQAKSATFKAAPNLQNAAPLLLELSQDLILTMKALKHALKRI